MNIALINDIFEIIIGLSIQLNIKRNDRYPLVQMKIEK